MRAAKQAEARRSSSDSAAPWNSCRTTASGHELRLHQCASNVDTLIQVRMFSCGLYSHYIDTCVYAQCCHSPALT